MYDENGMRYRTTITNKEDNSVGYLDYVWVDSKLVSISFTSDELNQTVKYLYNDFSEPVGFIATREDGSVDTFYYLKNAQGDITNIVSAAGKKMVSFTYDAFGKRTVEYQASNSTTPGQIELLTQMKADLLNPFAYRGYCYDYDMGMYYLQSRYYDPEVGRFINSDSTDYLDYTGTVLGCNLFAYCENDPVNFVDANGTSKVETLNKIAKNYYKTNEKLSVTFAKLLFANGMNYYTAFHELAQVVIGDKLYSSGYSVKLEYPCKNGEIDVVASKVFRKTTRYYMWEVKPLGASATKQLEKYKKAKPSFNLGFNPGTITRKICKDLKIKITFNNNGAAYYRFYNDKGKQISNKALADAIKSAIYKALAVGVAALAVTAIATVLIIYLSGGSATVPAVKVAATSASSVSATTLATIIPLAAEALSKAA